MWKLEDEYIFAVFQGPKTYGCLNTNLDSYSKVKGYKSNVSIESLERLLNRNNTGKLVLTQKNGIKNSTNKKLKLSLLVIN